MKPAPTGGQITLWNADPTEPPIVDMGLHTADADLTRLAMGIELLRNVMAHPILRQYEAAEVLPGPSYGTREQLEDYLRRYSAFGHHIERHGEDGPPHRSHGGRGFGMPRDWRGRPSRL